MKSYTDLEQSRKLAEILPIESADGFYEAQHNPLTDKWEYILFTGNKWASPEVVIPCWSLVALLEVLPEPSLFKTFDEWKCQCYKGFDIVAMVYSNNPVDACVKLIYKLKEKDLL